MKKPTPPLDELYQEVILDHSKHPRNEGILSPADFEAEGFNPLCGDRIRIFVGDGRIQFTAAGCAISKASASILTTSTSSIGPESLETLAESVIQFLAVDSEAPSPIDSAEFAAIAAVKKFPARLKCAALPWNTLLAALKK